MKYKHSVCSFAAFFVLIVTVFAIVMPFYIAFYMYHDWWSQHKILYEQPIVKFQHQFIFMAEHDDLNNAFLMEKRLVACTSYTYLNDILGDFVDCSSVKVGTCYIGKTICLQ